MLGKLIDKAVRTLSIVQYKIKYGNNAGVMKDNEYILKLDSYFDRNYSEIIQIMQETGELNIEQFKSLPIYEYLIKWREELTAILMKENPKNSEFSERFADMHIAYAIGMYTNLIGQTKQKAVC